MSRTQRTSQTPIFRAKTGLTLSAAYIPKKQMRNGAAQTNSPAQLLGSYHLAVEQNWQWKGIKGPNHQENLTMPASRWFPVCLGRDRAGDSDWQDFLCLGSPPGNGKPLWTWCRNCKKEENLYLKTHRESFNEDLLHFCSKPAALCNGLLWLLFFFFFPSLILMLTIITSCFL